MYNKCLIRHHTVKLETVTRRLKVIKIAVKTAGRFHKKV